METNVWTQQLEKKVKFQLAVGWRIREANSKWKFPDVE